MILLLFLFPVVQGELSNGLDYYLWQEHKLPMVELRLTLRSGSGYDPNQLPGLANITHQMLERSVEGYSYLELQDKIESMGARVSLHCDREYATISIRCLSKHLPEMIDILGLLLLRPRFSDDELMRLKSEIIGQIHVRRDRPFAIGFDNFYQLVYQGHPFGRCLLGTEESVQEINRDHIVEFYTKHYLPNVSAFVCCGDFEIDPLLEKLKKIFLDWDRGEVTKLAVPEELDTFRVKVVTKPLSQAYIFYGNIGISRKDSLFLAGRLGNFILGGSGLTSRLYTSIREEAGLAYIAFSRIYSGNFYHPFLSMVQTRIDSAPASLEKLLNEIEKAKEEGITPAELERAKSYYLGHFPIAFDSYREKADLLVQLHHFNLGVDYLDRFPDMIEDIKLADVKKMLARVLKKNFGLVVVGPLSKEDLRSWLSKISIE